VLPQKVEDKVGHGQQSVFVGVPSRPACRQLSLLLINSVTVQHRKSDLCGDSYRMQPHEVAHGHLVVVQGPHEGPQRAHASAIVVDLSATFYVAQPPPHRRAIAPGLHLEWVGFRHVLEVAPERLCVGCFVLNRNVKQSHAV
jgi:hypothetical protein